MAREGRVHPAVRFVRGRAAADLLGNARYSNASSSFSAVMACSGFASLPSGHGWFARIHTVGMPIRPAPSISFTG